MGRQWNARLLRRRQLHGAGRHLRLPFAPPAPNPAAVHPAGPTVLGDGRSRGHNHLNRHLCNVQREPCRLRRSQWFGLLPDIRRVATACRVQRGSFHNGRRRLVRRRFDLQPACRLGQSRLFPRGGQESGRAKCRVHARLNYPNTRVQRSVRRMDLQPRCRDSVLPSVAWTTHRDGRQQLAHELLGGHARRPRQHQLRNLRLQSLRPKQCGVGSSLLQSHERDLHCRRRHLEHCRCDGRIHHGQPPTVPLLQPPHWRWQRSVPNLHVHGVPSPQ